MKFSPKLWFFLVLLVMSCAHDPKKSMQPELANLQGKWQGPLLGNYLGSGTFFQKQIEVNNDKYSETINLYFSLNHHNHPKDSILVASFVETSTIKIIATPGQTHGLIEREEIVDDTYLKLSDISKNEPDKIFGGSASPRTIIDEFLSGGFNKKLASLTFDKENRTKIEGRQGLKQTLGHLFFENNEKWENYFIHNGKPTVDALGSKFIRIH